MYSYKINQESTNTNHSQCMMKVFFVSFIDHRRDRTSSAIGFLKLTGPFD